MTKMLKNLHNARMQHAFVLYTATSTTQRLECYLYKLLRL